MLYDDGTFSLSIDKLDLSAYISKDKGIRIVKNNIQIGLNNIYGGKRKPNKYKSTKLTTPILQDLEYFFLSGLLSHLATVVWLTCNIIAAFLKLFISE